MNIVKTQIKWNTALQKRLTTSFIVLHHAEASNCSIQDIDFWHKQNKWSGVGYHFLVRKDGSVYEGRPLDTVGAHCLGVNDRSIGICAEGDYQKETMPDIQKQSIINLLFYIKTIYPNIGVFGHNEKSPSECPGKNYPLDEIKNAKSKDLTIEEAITKLVNNKIISSPDYWINNTKVGQVCKGEYVAQLIKNMAMCIK